MAVAKQSSVRDMSLTYGFEIGRAAVIFDTCRRLAKRVKEANEGKGRTERAGTQDISLFFFLML